MTRLRVAVDIGGTFTDVCVFDEDSATMEVAKIPSTTNPINAVIEGVDSLDVSLDDVGLFCHGTTVATNALITRNFRPAAMVTTAGFRDVIEIGRGTKDDLWDHYHDVPAPYIRRRDRLEVPERIDFQGDVVTPLDEEQARDVARILARREVASVAICFINAYANPDHERRMKEILEEQLPGVAVCTSSDILPEIFEHERFSTTVANAVVAPLVTRYVSDLAEELERKGYAGDLLLLHSGGGVMTARGVERLPVRLAASGLAAGAIASRHLAGLAGFENAIGLDMGGTSTDISVVRGGDLRTTSEWTVEYGQPICLPSIEVLTIGAGGGSLAWIDEGGSLRNGPQSAGAVPGPACYDRGGELPTNTDANLFLGRLSGSLIGGAMQLSVERADEAIRRHIAEPLGLSTPEAAHAILQVANANMADALRLVSIRRGYDPRDFALVTFGGAGALHGVALARELAIPNVLVPLYPGISSALGCLLVDIQHDLASMLLSPLGDLDVSDVESRFLALEAEARERLAAEGADDDAMAFDRSIDMRYRGQWRSLAVPVPSPLVSLEDAAADFHREHDRQFSFRRDDVAVEAYRLNVRATAVSPKPDLARETPEAHEPAGFTTRDVLFDPRDGFVETRIYQRADLRAGAEMSGPAVIQQMDSTVVIPPGVTAAIDEWLNIIVNVPLENA